MHLQIKCPLTKSGPGGPGARDINEDDPGVTVARTGRAVPSGDAAVESFAALAAKLDYLDAGDLKRVREAYLGL